ncbi:MAG: filamentous hemagglutinin N-terminal domain-containing protein [Gammaproteobacteria bacterium]|nr:filamentous hemagglutinin N-terminal domain-containing protein [Gammaproteobacteria bacterium]
MFSPVIFSRGLGQRLFAFNIGILASIAASANPHGPEVIAGTVGFAAPNPQTLDITNAPGAIINWQSFDIGAGETTRFIQQDAASAVLNRVTTANTSEIFGQLLSNGHVFLINPAGLLIGRDAVIDTAGLVMSTLDIKDADFAAGKLHFEGGPASGGITNHGYIKTAANGEIVLIAPKILNAPEAGAAGVESKSGIIESPNGQLILAAGYSITLSSLNDPNISFEVRAPENSVVNLGALIAKGGTARVLASTIKNAGEINADTLTVDKTGRVMLVASDRVETTPASRISAQGGDGLAGGAVTVEAKQVAVSGEINVSGDTAGGTAHVLGDEIATSAKILANAAHGDGGQIRVGGDYKGGATLRAAEITTVDTASRLQANGGDKGKGGTAVTWSTKETQFRGSAEARGGLRGGNGGLVEISGKDILRYSGTADVGAPAGDPGTLLFDPGVIVIVAGSASTSAGNPLPFADDRFGSSFSILPSGNILVLNQSASPNGVAQAGAITVLDRFGTVLGNITGNAANQRLGSFGFLFNSQSNLIIRDPNAPLGTLTQVGSVFLLDQTSGAELGRVSGVSAGEQFGQTLNFFGTNYLIRSTSADISGIGVDAGLVMLVNGLTGKEIGRVTGNSPGELFGQNLNFVGANYVIRSPGAAVSGIGANVGAVVLASGTTGTELGRVSGGTVNEGFGTTVDFFGVPTGTYLVRSPTASPNGLNSGTAVLVDNSTGLEKGRTNGLTANDSLGSFAPILRASGNYFLQVPDATIGGIASAGSLVLVRGTNGQRIGTVDGNALNERFSNNSFFNNLDRFSFGASDVLVTSINHSLIPGANDRAGGLFMVADVDLGVGGFGGNNILRGRTLGVSPNELFGSTGFQFVGSNLVVTSPLASTGSFTNNGSVSLLSRATATLISPSSHIDGTSNNERLGQDGVIIRSGNYFIPSKDFNTATGILKAGSLILADGTTGLIIDRLDGDTPNEQAGCLSGCLSNSRIDQFSLPNGDLLVYAPTHGNGQGRVGQVSPVDLGVIPLGPGDKILRGRVRGFATGNGVTTGDRVGAENAIFLPNGKYLLPVPTFTNSSGPLPLANAGAVVVVDPATAGTLGVIAGDTANERLGVPAEIDTTLLAGRSTAIVRNGNHGGKNGEVFFIDFSSGSLVVNTFNGLANDQAGSDPLLLANNGNIIVPMPNASPGLFSKAGSVALLNGATHALLGRTDGISLNEGFGSSGQIDTRSLFGPDFLVHSRNRSTTDLSGGTSLEGAVAIVSGTAGTVLGVVSGQQPLDRLGEIASAHVLNNGNFVLFNPSATKGSGPGALSRAGAVILVDSVLHQEKGGLARIYGQSINEQLGIDQTLIERLNGNYFLTSSLASPGGKSSAGSIYLVDGSTGGTLLGQADGTTPGEGFGGNFDTFTLLGTDDILVTSLSHQVGSFANAGTIVQLASVNLGPKGIIRGRLDGGGANELLGRGGVRRSDNTHYFTVSALADTPGGAAAGSIRFVDMVTGTETNRIDGISANENLGGLGSIFNGSNGNLFIFSPNADVAGASQAGRVIVATTAGTVLGSASGNTAKERFGEQFSAVGTDQWIFAPQHNNGAGGIFAVTDKDLGGGNIVRASLLGATAGDQVGARFFDFARDPNTRVIRVPEATVGGLAKAGTAILVDLNLRELGRTNGTSQDELFSNNSFQVIRSGDLIFASPLADINGLKDVGTVKLVSGKTGTLIGETTGIAANDRFGGGERVFTRSLRNDGILVVNPEATVGGMANAGAIVQIDPATGKEIRRVVGINPDERLGSFGFQTLSDGRLLFGSPNATINGQLNAGRLVFFDSISNTQTQATNLLFSNTPNGDFLVTTGAIENALNSGANLILQANSDILIQKGAVLTGSGGSLTLQAGRSIIINGLLNLPATNLKLVANETAANGVDPKNRGLGSGDFVLNDPQVVGRNVDLSAQTVQLVGGTDPKAKFLPTTSDQLFVDFLKTGALNSPATFILALESLKIAADNLNVLGGASPGAFAGLASLGRFDLTANTITLTSGAGDGAHALLLGLGGLANITFKTCTGCGTDPLFTDPFLDFVPKSGIFIAGLSFDQPIQAILAMNPKNDKDDKDKKKNKEAKQCGI